MVIGFGTTLVLARILAPEDFGLFAMTIAIVGLAEILRDFGFMNAAVQAPTLSQAQRSNLFWLNTLLGAGLGFALAVMSPLIADFFGEPRLVELARAIAVVFVLNGVSVQFKANLVRDLRITRVNVAETVAQALGAIAAVIAAFAGAEYWALAAQQLVVAAVALMLLMVMARWVPGLPARAPMKKLFVYGWNLTLQQALTYVVRNVDTIAIGRQFGATSLGFYDRAYQLLMIPIGQFNAPLTRVAVPTLSRLWNAGGDFERYLHVAQKVAAFVTVPVFAILVGYGTPVVEILLGEGWAVAGVALQLLAVGGIFRSLMQVTYWAYLSSGATGIMLRFDMIALPLVAVAIVAGLPWGIYGVAAAHSIGYAVYWFAGLWWMCRKLGLSLTPFLQTAARSVLLVALPTATVGFALSQFALAPVLGLAAVLLGAALVVGVLSLLFPALRRDYGTVLKVVKLAIRK
ncbi:lipopolysaccharide biosynthesis protein (plasmid) [Coraliomargarita sp. W4R53]